MIQDPPLFVLLPRLLACLRTQTSCIRDPYSILVFFHFPSYLTCPSLSLSLFVPIIGSAGRRLGNESVRSLGRGSAGGRSASLGSTDSSHFPTAAATAEELIASIGLEPRYTHPGRHLETFQHLARFRIDSPQIAPVIFPSTVPERSVNPGDPRNKSSGLDAAKNRPRLRIDLIDLPLLIVGYPQRPFGPGQTRVTAAGGRRDRCQHFAGIRIDLLDAIIGDLIQVSAVKGRSGMCGDINRAQYFPANRIKSVQLVFDGNPDLLTVIGDPIHPRDAREGSILTDDFGC